MYFFLPSRFLQTFLGMFAIKVMHKAETVGIFVTGSIAVCATNSDIMFLAVVD